MSEEKVDIWMPLDIGSYLADTSHLSTEQHGAYLLLMMHYWRKGPLPNDMTILANIARLSKDAWSIHQALLMQFFFLDTDGLLHQRRSDRELAKAKENRVKANKRAKTAAGKRWENARNHASSNATSNAQALLEECPLPSPSPNTNTPPTAHATPIDADPLESIPEGLTPVEYSRELLAELVISAPVGLQDRFAQTLTMLAGLERCTLAEATKRLVKRMRAAMDEGPVKWRLWLEDDGWKGVKPQARASPATVGMATRAEPSEDERREQWESMSDAWKKTHPWSIGAVHAKA